MLSVKAQVLSSWEGLKALLGEAGANVGSRAAIASLPVSFGVDPFSSLGKAADRRETASRKQIASAVMLYGYLKKKLGQERALEIMQPVIVAGTLAFLKHTLGDPPVELYRKSSLSERNSLINDMMQRFFNATAEIESLDDSLFSVKVTDCLFPRLCRAAEVPELAHLFCQGDLHYFNRSGSPVMLQREGTIAEGYFCCPFVFTINP